MKFFLYETLTTPGTINLALTMAGVPEEFPNTSRVEVWASKFDSTSTPDRTIYRVFDKKNEQIKEIVKEGY
jgi:hypothetical protein